MWVPIMQSHIATSLGPQASSGGLERGSDQFGMSSLTTNDAQSTGTILEDGVAPGYCDVGSPNTAGGDLGCSDNSGSNHVAVADSSTTEAP